MKKFLGVFLCLLMFVSMITTNTSAAPTVIIKKPTIPESQIVQGKTFSVGGIINSNAPISSVKVQVLDSNGVKQTGGVVYPNNTKIYNIATVLDKKTEFDKLTPGVKTYRVTAVVSEREFVLVNSIFSVIAEIQPLSDGYYTISPQCAPDRVLDVVNGSSNGKIQLYSKVPGVEAQKFKLTHIGNNYYTITCCTGKVLDVTNGIAQNNTLIQQYPPNNTDAQKWLIEYSGENGYFYIVSKKNLKMRMDVYNGADANGTSIQLYSSANVPAQKWKFSSISSSQYAVFPVSSMNISQLAYENYSHGASNAIDCYGATYLFAPFRGKIVNISKSCTCVLFQSIDEVYYADGSRDHMTIQLLHGNNYKELLNHYNNGTIFEQGDPFYEIGGIGNSGTTEYALHFDIQVARGKINNLANKYTLFGNVLAYNAFYIDSKMTPPPWNKGKAQCQVLGGYKTNWSNEWRLLPQ